MRFSRCLIYQDENHLGQIAMLSEAESGAEGGSRTHTGVTPKVFEFPITVSHQFMPVHQYLRYCMNLTGCCSCLSASICRCCCQIYCQSRSFTLRCEMPSVR